MIKINLMEDVGRKAMRKYIRRDGDNGKPNSFDMI
jgi:hypothetical protein